MEIEAKGVSKMNPIETQPDASIANGVKETSAASAIETSTEFTLGNRLRIDERGHAIPLTEAEQVADTEAYLAALAEMALIPDDPPGSDEAFWRAMDAAHPDRPMFKELYGK